MVVLEISLIKLSITKKNLYLTINQLVTIESSLYQLVW